MARRGAVADATLRAEPLRALRGARIKNTQVRVSESLALVQRDYRGNEKRSAYIVNLYNDNRLLPFFGDRSANYVLEKTIDDYKDKRLAEGASKVTVSRELQVLKRAYNLGLEHRLIKSAPVMELFPEPPPREGHYEIGELKRFVEAARAALPFLFHGDDLRKKEEQMAKKTCRKCANSG